jgi:hypothetical protein
MGIAGLKPHQSLLAAERYKQEMAERMEAHDNIF